MWMRLIMAVSEAGRLSPGPCSLPMNHCSEGGQPQLSHPWFSSAFQASVTGSWGAPRPLRPVQIRYTRLKSTLSGRDGPQLHRAVGAGGGDRSTIRGKGNAEYHPLVAPPGRQEPATLHVPQFDRAVLVRRRQELIVGAEGE